MSAGKHNVFLVGPMGSGKTTIGRQIAAELGLVFHDCDQDLEQSTGASVNLIFDIEGEAGFRDRETAMLKRLAADQGVLVATGGGVVLRSENREILKQAGLVVWLKTTVEQQLNRLNHDKTRPLLQTDDREARLRQLAKDRNALYQEVADLAFTTPNRNSRYAARALCQKISDYLDTADKENRHACR